MRILCGLDVHKISEVKIDSIRQYLEKVELNQKKKNTSAKCLVFTFNAYILPFRPYSTTNYKASL